MDAEVALRRDELRLQISALVEEKCSLEVALSLHHERLEAQVQLHSICTIHSQIANMYLTLVISTP
jgi:hypothetical protein